MSGIPQSLRDKEPALVELLELLANLPRFDRTKKACELQGDLPEVYEAERIYHTFNKRYSRRKTVDEQGKSHSVVEYQPLLVELFKLADWRNFQDLLRHSTPGRERKKRSNEKQRAKLKQHDPEAWYFGCRAKRRARLEQWQAENGPRLLRQLAAAEQLGATDKLKADVIRYEVLNELEAKFTDEDRARCEYDQYKLRVLLGLYTATRDDEIEAKLEKLAQDIWGPDDAREALMSEIAKNHPPIATDWTALETALEAGEVPASGDKPQGD